MAFYTGSTGTIRFKKFLNANMQDNSVNNLKITQWTLNTSAQLLDTTTLGDYDKTSVYGIRTHTGSLRLLYYTDQEFSTPQKNAASWFVGALTRPRFHQNRAGSDFANDETPDSYAVRLQLFLKQQSLTDNALQDTISFDANLTSIGYASTVNEVTSVDVQFEAFGRIDKMNL